MPNSVQTLLGQILSYQYNPAAMQRSVLQMLSDITNGDIEIVDPTNPVVFTLESAAVMAAAFMAKNEANTRKQYPVVAQTPEDLYLHMSDLDYVDRFVTPAQTKFSILVNKAEALNKMVLDPVTGIKKIVIPRNTYFTVVDTIFSLQYPIEIRQLQHGGLQVVYDASKVSPLQELPTNVIDWEIRTGPDGDWIFFEFDVFQFDIVSQMGSLSAAADFKMDIGFTDQFYFARVFQQLTDGTWQEIQTTHTEQVYDPNVPTAVLQVVDQTLTVRIPQIYTNTGLMGGNVRVDVYESKGALNMMLQNYPPSSYTATWQAYDKNDQTEFTAPLKTMRQIILYSDKTVDGGVNALTFEELRTRVINNAVGEQQLPITNAQLQAAMQNLGYDIVKNIDVITNRVFLATRTMPAPIDPKLITAAAASVETVTFSVNDIAHLPTVVDNVSSVTITPDTLYRYANGIPSIVSVAEVQQIQAMPPDQRAVVVTGGGYLYTPFHYVLDLTLNEFAVRPYYLDAPITVTKLFVAENDTTLLQVATDSYSIQRTPTGYLLEVVTKSGDSFKALSDDELFVQLAFVPAGERDRAYLNGVLVGKNSDNERIYHFDLSTTFNVDLNDNLELTKFVMYTTDERITKSSLLQNFDLVYSTTSVMPSQWKLASVDTVLGRVLLPANAVGITQETLRVQFGWSLNTLWARARSVADSIQYKKYAVDVPRVYQQDIYNLDPVTGASFTIDSSGQIQYNILHHKGDPVLDGAGNPVYAHRAGDVMLDAMGLPIILNPRGIIRQVDLMLIEGAYWFATDTVSTTYRSEMTRTVVDWLSNELKTMNGELLEQTRIYFYPKTTLGNITVMVKDGLTMTIPAGQSLKVSLSVNGKVYANDALKAQIELITVQTISNMLAQSTVSLSEIETALVALYGNDVIDVEVSGLAGNTTTPVVTLMNDGDRLSLRKRLVAMSDNTLAVQEDVTIDWVRHEIPT